MPNIRAQVVLPMFTNLPSDVITNTLNFDETVPATLEAAAAALQPIIEDFYRDIYSTDMWADYLSINTAHINFYRMDQPPPRVPVTTNLFTSTLPVVDPSVLPTEVSVVLSFQGERLGGTPQARRRGRIYLGGLASNAVTVSSSSSFPLVNAAFRARIGTAASAFMAACETANFPWVVWSETDQLMVPVTNGWVDNAPDTQRRRSIDSNLRTLWS